MKFNLTISRKLGLNNLSIVIFVVAIAIYSVIKLNNVDRLNELMVDSLQPSIETLSELQNGAARSQSLTKKWLEDSDSDKNQLIQWHAEYPEKKVLLLKYAKQWGDDRKVKDIVKALAHNDSILVLQNQIMSSLLSDEDYLNMGFDEAKKREYKNIYNRVDYETSILRKELTLLHNEWINDLSAYKSQILNASNSIRQVIYVLILLVIVVALISFFVTYNNIVRPITTLKEAIHELSLGKHPELDVKASNDEVGDMVNSLHQLVNGMKTISNFSTAVGEGNLDASFTPISQDDLLGNSLITMQANLKRVANEEHQRSWAIQGTAKFGELLRDNNQNLELLCKEIITTLVEYTEVNQGGIFVLKGKSEEEKVLELVSAYAFDRVKFTQTQLKIGEGLVGQCWQEMESIFLTDIPNDFMHIKSGLGGTNPKCILIAPLIVNEQIYGVIELAAFEEIEQYKIDFVEKIGESIAATLSSVQININTNKLLTESKNMAEQLQSQEEELRQNTEEMMATQEEMEKRIRLLENKLSKYE